jgi:hypothetical protein
MLSIDTPSVAEMLATPQILAESKCKVISEGSRKNLALGSMEMLALPCKDNAFPLFSKP